MNHDVRDPSTIVLPERCPSCDSKTCCTIVWHYPDDGSVRQRVKCAVCFETNEYKDGRLFRTARPSSARNVFLDDWRKHLRVGDVIRVRHDDGEVRTHVVRGQPRPISSGPWVVWLTGVTGCYDLGRVVHEDRMPVGRIDPKHAAEVFS